MNEKDIQKKHNLTLKGRKELNIDGVKEVISYNENKIFLQTNMGGLELKGSDLNIQQLNLDNSSINITGHIDLIQYTKGKTETNFIKRLFK